MSNHELPIVAITMSEASGIGPEILAKVFANPEIFQVCRPLAIGNKRVMERALSLFDNRVTVRTVEDPADGAYTYGTMDLMEVGDLP